MRFFIVCILFPLKSLSNILLYHAFSLFASAFFKKDAVFLGGTFGKGRFLWGTFEKVPHAPQNFHGMGFGYPRKEARTKNCLPSCGAVKVFCADFSYGTTIV
jgi:hypothetical protein